MTGDFVQILRNGRPINLFGRVVWQTKYNAFVKFKSGIRRFHKSDLKHIDASGVPDSVREIEVKLVENILEKSKELSAFFKTFGLSNSASRSMISATLCEMAIGLNQNIPAKTQSEPIVV